MILTEIPTQIFLNRLERLVRLRNDPYRIVMPIYDLLKNYLESGADIRTIKIMNTFDTTTILIGGTMLEYTEDRDRRWIATYLGYKPTQKEQEELLEKVK
ncbi:MAG: hypothetical protein QXK24_07445 [Ignisphaera sp.]